jgi:hypothetical protein
VKPKPYVALALYWLLAGAAGAASNGALEELMKQLQSMRSLPPGTSTDAKCPPPENLAFLRGMKRLDVLAALSSPDFEEEAASGLEWSYFLTSPRRGVVDSGESLEVTVGGGFPTVTFFFTKQDETGRVTCAYAR